MLLDAPLVPKTRKWNIYLSCFASHTTPFLPDVMEGVWDSLFSNNVIAGCLHAEEQVITSLITSANEVTPVCVSCLVCRTNCAKEVPLSEIVICEVASLIYIAEFNFYSLLRALVIYFHVKSMQIFFPSYSFKILRFHRNTTPQDHIFIVQGDSHSKYQEWRH